MTQTISMKKSNNLFHESTPFPFSIDSKSNRELEGEDDIPKMEPAIKRELITPERAKELLSINGHNRRVREPAVIRYSKDMKLGRWKENTFELIKIAPDGKILDGQHRLMAVVKAAQPIWFHIAYNVPGNVFDVLDTGSIRSGCDVFKIAGVLNESVMPSIIQQYFVLKNGKNVKENANKNNKLTNNQLLEWYHKNENFWQHVVRKAHTWYKSFAKILNPSSLGGFYAYFYSINETDAENFMNQLSTGQNIENEVVAQLRTRLMQDKMSLRKISPTVKYGLIVKAWNAYRAKKSVKLLRFDPEKESFPTAI